MQGEGLFQWIAMACYGAMTLQRDVTVYKNLAILLMPLEALMIATTCCFLTVIDHWSGHLQCHAAQYARKSCNLAWLSLLT